MRVPENDQLFPDEIREEGKKSLEEKGIKHEVKVYPNVPHGMVLSQSTGILLLLTSVGFATVGEYEDPKIQEAQREAFEQMLAWLKAH